ncbi:MAG: molybdopterin-containing oxidoreductase family protein [bacterium]
MPIEILPSACTMDCPDTCSLEVEVEDGRIKRLRGSRVNPLTDGFICSKVGNFAQRVYSKDRLLHPMRRVGRKGSGEFERITWDEAIAMICARFKEIQQRWGGEAILPYNYGGSNGMLGQGTSDAAFFSKLGASRLAHTVCAAPTSTVAKAMYGKMPGVAFEDYAQARFILIWGANPKASNIHLVPYLKQAKAAGAKIAVVDPMVNFSKKESDLHLPVYPGTDLVVALAMIHYWHEHGMLNHAFIAQHTTGAERLLEKAAEYPLEKAARIARVEASAIAQLAKLYAETEPAVLRCGWGLERNRNGGQAAAAILAMPALLGKFGKRGGGYTMSNSGAYRVDETKLADAVPWQTREINMNLLGKVLLEEKNPPIKALFVYNCNPVATVPNQNAIIAGLQREDLFTVVFEQVMTDTAVFADILLPAVTFLEQKEIKKAYGSYALQYLEPVIAPRGEAKPNEEVFAMLGRTMGWTDKAFDDDTEAYLRRAVNAIGGMGKIDFATLQKERIAFFDFPGRRPVQFETALPWTSDGKAHLAPEVLGDNPFEYLDEYANGFPLTLISPATDKLISSSLGEFNLPELFVTLHPADAQSRLLKNGDRVRVYNHGGEVHCRVKVSEMIRSGVAAMPKGAWRKASANGQTATALAPDTLSAVGGGACFNDARVEVERL